MHVLHQPDPNKRQRFCNWLLEKVNSGELDAKEIFLVTRCGFIYMDRCFHKITGITVTEKQSECLGAAVVQSPIRRRASQTRPRATGLKLKWDCHQGLNLGIQCAIIHRRYIRATCEPSRTLTNHP